VPDATVQSYHGQPVIKQPVWTWEIPTYLFTGGLAGGSTGLAYLSQLDGNYVLARRAWTVALAATTASPVLLILDLGRPLRFLNMLRMVKLTSPMSIGSWVLAANGAGTALDAINAWTGLLPRAARVARPAAGLLGLPLSTYTAALLANTAVPVWHEARRQLPFVFASGAALSAGSVAVIVTPTTHAAPARRLALAGAASELVLTNVMERGLGQHGEPYGQGAAHRFGNVSRACTTAGAALLAWRGASSRRVAVAAGALMSAGALAARWSVFKAGFQSAADPKYVVAPQRSAIEQGRRRGAARRQSRVAQADPSIGSPATTV
jgi:formate-dependent nitrite reductase membrane component NrfD